MALAALGRDIGLDLGPLVEQLLQTWGRREYIGGAQLFGNAKEIVNASRRL